MWHVMKDLLMLVAFQCLLGSASSNEFVRNASAHSESENVGHLMNSLFSHYNREIIPMKPVFLSVNLLVLKVKTIIERDGIFESVIALFLRWQDPRMQWDPLLYNNLSEITFRSEKIWLPDVAMTNSADHTYSISKDTTFVIRATHDGVFDFIPTGTAKTWCDLKLLKFPFDVQSCSIEFESWSLNSHSLLFNDTAKVLLDTAFSSLQFSLCSMSTQVSEFYYKITDESFSRLKFTFVVRRKSSFYMTNLIFPVTTLSMIQPFVFLIPLRESSSDRVGFATTNLLTLVVFQTIVTAEMPKTSDGITTLSKYIISLVIMSGWSICQSILVERCVQMESGPPKWLSRCLKKLCPFACARPVKRTKLAEKKSNSGGRTTFRKCRESECGTQLLSLCTMETDDQIWVLDNMEEIQSSSSRIAQPSRMRTSPSPIWVFQNPESTRTTNFSLDDVPDYCPLCLSATRPKEEQTETSPILRREPSNGSLAEEEHESWEDVVARVDCIMFVVCFILTLFIPFYLFLPIVMANDACTPE